MKYPTESALENHYLESILPYDTYEQHPPIIKDKNFYKPEQFIWNNPHRTSSQMYKFYHHYNDQFEQKRHPLLQKLEDQDRQTQEINRIIKLTNIRNQIRQNFHHRQQHREQIQAKTRKHSMPSSNRQTNQFGSMLNSQLNRPTPNQINNRSHIHASERLIKMQGLYQEGLKKYDQKRQEVSKLLIEQAEESHHKIRQDFNSRKLKNQTTSNKFRPITKKKLIGSNFD